MGFKANPTEPIVVKRAEVVPKPLGKNATITRHPYYDGFAAGYGVGFSTASFPPGEECGMHNHRGGNEQFYVASGQGTFVVEDSHFETSPGDLIVVPVGMNHNIIATGSEPLVLVYQFITAVGHEDDTEPWRQIEVG